MEKQYLTTKEVSELLNVTTRTIHTWNHAGKLKCIYTKGGHRRFLRSDVVPHVSPTNSTTVDELKRRVCYCRVSTSSQKEDLDRQIEYLRNKYPEYEIVKDVGSGLNFKRKGFNSILDDAIRGNIAEIVVTHKDRLCRFGFDLVERIVEQHSNGRIVVLNQSKTSPQEELVNDLLSIITVFSSRIYGLRSHSLKTELKDKVNAAVKNDNLQTISHSTGGRGTPTHDDTVSMVL